MTIGHDGQSKLRLVVVQPTPFCNIDCNYCYLPHRKDKQRMAIGTVVAIKAFLEGVPKIADRLVILWHGGEPLAAGLNFYEAAFKIFDRDSFDHGIRHSIQTNATLIDEQWCVLFKRHDVSLGVSIDGPRHVHDARRMTRSGRGTFDDVMRAIELLKSYDIDFSTLSVVTPQMLEDVEGTLDFLRSLGGKSIAFNVEEVKGSHSTSELYPICTKETLSSFFRRLTTLQRDQPKLRIRGLDLMRSHLLAPADSDILRSTNKAGSIINFDVRGNVTTFSPELLGNKNQTYGSFAWANALDGSWSTLLANPAFQKVNAAISDGVRRCRETCGYFTVCGGGDPSNKLAEHGRLDGSETNACRFSVQAVADVIVAELEEQVLGARSAMTETQPFIL
jgi:uncharacterized protein